MTTADSSDVQPQAKRIGPTDPRHLMTVTVHLEPRIPLPSAHEIGARPPATRKHLSRAEYARTFGAHPDHVALVERFAATHGMTVTSVDHGHRTVRLRGSVGQLQRAFRTQIEDVEIDGVRHQVQAAPVTLPAPLAAVVKGVFGMDTRPLARPQFHLPQGSSSGTFTPPQVAQLYGFPALGNGAGQTIALIELGGGYSDAQLPAYWEDLGLSSAPLVTSVSVLGAQNDPASEASTEVQLDIEVAGSIAPGAKIVVYFAPNTDQGFIDAVNQAIHDTTNMPDIISISWGSAECNWSANAKTVMDGVFQSAAPLGVSIFVAAGDHGSSDGIAGTHVDFPASSPNCTACGGTTLAGSGTMVSSEVTWNDKNGNATGGGVSDFFPPPQYQQQVELPSSPNTGRPGRGLPDVAGDADPVTGYQVQINGVRQVVGGTSAVAPLWAALTALLNEATGTPLGFLNPQLYAGVVSCGGFNDITQGNNITNRSQNQWLAGPGWDPCTGLGSPNGDEILATLQPT